MKISVRISDSVSSRVSGTLSRSKSRRRFSAFTLAELVVVVTILAILAAVGFVVLSGYAGDAREAVSKANIRSVYSAISAESVRTSNSPRYYVIHDPSYALSGSAFVAFDAWAVTLVPGDWNAPGTNYSAGNPDWIKLKMDSEKFRISGTDGFFGDFAESVFAATDPAKVLIGAADVLESANASVRPRSFVQAAGIVSQGSAFVVGNYPVDLSGSVAGLVKDIANPSSTGALLDGAKTGAAPGCNVATSSGYSVPALSSGQSVSVSKTAANGSVSGTFSCSFGVRTLAQEAASCDSGYVPAAGPSCVADVCGSTVPAHATSTASSQSVSGTWHYAASAGQCTFACVSNYTWDGAACRSDCTVPVSDTYSGQTYAVSPNGALAHGASLPASASAAFGTSPANGSLTASFSYSCSDGSLSRTAVPGTGACQTNFTWNSSWSSPSCAGNGRTFACAAKPATGTVWNTVSSYGQTWNGSAWLPADSATSYDTTASTTSCAYACASGYGWDGTSACLASVNGACGSANKTYAYSASSYGADTYCASWTPSASPAFPAAGASATWTCSGLYGGSASATCTASHTAGANCLASAPTVNAHPYSVSSFNHSTTVSPTSVVAISNGTSTYQQTFSCTNGVVATSGAESNTVNSCNSGYSWNGSSCVANSWSSGSWGSCSGETGTWGYSAWGSCSVTCWGGTQSRTSSCTGNGNGTQSRTVQCLKYDGSVLADAACLTAKPGTSQSCTQSSDSVCGTVGATSQSCNTQACPVNGVCNNAVQYACSVGTSTSNVAGSCGGSSTWTCAGANGGTNASCSKANAACVAYKWTMISVTPCTGPYVACTGTVATDSTSPCSTYGATCSKYVWASPACPDGPGWIGPMIGNFQCK